MHPLCRLHPPKAKCTPLNGRCTPLSVFLSKRDNSSIKRSSHPQGWGDLFIKEGGIRTEGSWQHAGGIAALRRRGRMKQGRNFRSRAVLRAEALCRDPETANAARRKSEPRPGPPAGGESHPVRQQKNLFCLPKGQERFSCCTAGAVMV